MASLHAAEQQRRASASAATQQSRPSEQLFGLWFRARRVRLRKFSARWQLRKRFERELRKLLVPSAAEHAATGRESAFLWRAQPELWWILWPPEQRGILSRIVQQTERRFLSRRRRWRIARGRRRWKPWWQRAAQQRRESRQRWWTAAQVGRTQAG